jgi:hypothetical protein
MFRLARFIAKWCAITALCLLFSEFSVRVWGVWPTYQLAGKGVGGGKGITFFTLDAETLFRMIPNGLHQINADGFRDTKPTRPGERLITVSGDSFPMGLVVEPEQTFPKQLEKLLANRPVYNMGVQGFGPDQSLVAFRRFGVPLRPSRALLALYPSNDFNDLLKNHLFETDADEDTLIPVHPNPIEEVVPVFRLPMALRLITTGRFLPAATEEHLSNILFNDKETDDIGDQNEYRKAQTLMKLVIREFKRVALAHSIVPSAIVIPSYRDLENVPTGAARSHLDVAALAICRDEGMEVIDLYPSFSTWRGESLYSEADKHLSAVGHAEAARIIARALPNTEHLPPEPP